MCYCRMFILKFQNTLKLTNREAKSPINDLSKQLYTAQQQQQQHQQAALQQQQQQQLAQHQQQQQQLLQYQAQQAQAQMQAQQHHQISAGNALTLPGEQPVIGNNVSPTVNRFFLVSPKCCEQFITDAFKVVF